MSRWFLALGHWVVRHPWRVLFTWALIIALGAWGAHNLAQVAVGGEGGVPGSPSRLAGDALRTEFTNPFLDPLLVAVSCGKLRVDDAPYASWLRQTAERLAALPEVRRVASYTDSHDAHLRSADGHATMLLVGLAAKDNAGQQRGVVAVRAALAPLRAQLLHIDPSAHEAVTGGPAADFDVNAWSAAGGDRAEKRALPLTLLILAVAFGTLVAASLPFLMGLTTTTVSLGMAFLLAQLMPVSNLLGNVVTMIGLAIGIDYSLLMVTHYRQQIARSTPADTVAATVAGAGRTISWSGLTVMIGLLGLLFSPILETRCVGIGGALVVCISVLAALTLLPAILVLVGPLIDRLPVIPRRLHRSGKSTYWRRLGRWIVRHPLVTLIVSGACVLALGAPALQAKSGFTHERWFLPPVVESRVGAEILTRLRSENASSPVYVIVRTSDGSPILAAAHLEPLVSYAARLAKDRRIASVNSAFSLREDLGLDEYSALYEDPDQALRDYPSIAQLYLSRNRHAALFQITPADGLNVQQLSQLARDLAANVPAGRFTVSVGGTAAEHNDFNHYMFRSLPRIFGFVVGATLVLLFVAFRSYLLPLSAVLTNLLAVCGGIGAVIAIFQLGWLNGLVGLERPFETIPLEVPLLVFCLSFGLSMDYELFLLFRIQQEYAKDRNNERAIIEGLAAVAPVITGAGLIMVVVFGAFIGAELPVLKMTGVGLCVAVFIDATVIRAFVVPAAMALAGRWNWYPGRRQAR